jgi:membrane protease YdiL (CAAX protease family)
MHIPIAYAFMPLGFHLVAALLLGITAGFCEEVQFRAFLMTEFANASYGKVMQVLMPGVAFGLAHAGYLNQGTCPLARHHAAHRVSRYDVGNCVPPWTPQLAPGVSRPLLERRNGASLDRILYGYGFVGSNLERGKPGTRPRLGGAPSLIASALSEFPDERGTLLRKPDPSDR